MKVRLWILIAAAALACAGGIACIAAAAAYEGPERQEERELISAGYILAAAEGNIGVYRGGELIMRTDVRLEGLRRGDRELIEAGIHAETYEDVMKLLQDFDA